MSLLTATVTVHRLRSWDRGDRKGSLHLIVTLSGCRWESTCYIGRQDDTMQGRGE